MKSIICCFLVLSIPLVCIPAKAQEPLVLYDNFNSTFMDIEKWTSSESRGTGVTLLETVRGLDDHRLYMVARAFGNTVPISSPPAPPVPSLGTRPGDVNSAFGVTEVFQSLKVSVKVSRAQATGCPDFNATPTTARARLLGFYFNATNPSATPGNRIGDVLAQVRIQRSSNSTDKPHILEVWVDVVRCLDTGCGTSSNDGLLPVQLGKIKLGQWATIQIDWDRVRYFIVKLNKESAVAIDVLGPKNPGAPLWNVYPVSSPWNALGVSNRLAANCPENERALGYVEAEFDNLFVRSFP
jgi:hypothetical protein